MKKSKLIELLNALEGDPDIVLWNGMVGDWMDISPKLIQGELVKQTFNTFCSRVEYEEKRTKNDWDHTLKAEDMAELKSCYKKNYNWEMNDFVTLEDIKEKRYQVKKVLFLNAKPRGVSTWDRFGNISY